MQNFSNKLIQKKIIQDTRLYRLHPRHRQFQNAGETNVEKTGKQVKQNEK